MFYFILQTFRFNSEKTISPVIILPTLISKHDYSINYSVDEVHVDPFTADVSVCFTCNDPLNLSL